jgi:hypothetical protein
MSVKQNKEKKIKTKCVWKPSNLSVKKTIIFTDLKRLTLIQEPVELEKVILQFKHMKTLS